MNKKNFCDAYTTMQKVEPFHAYSKTSLKRKYHHNIMTRISVQKLFETNPIKATNNILTLNSFVFYFFATKFSAVRYFLESRSCGCSS